MSAKHYEHMTHLSSAYDQIRTFTLVDDQMGISEIFLPKILGRNSAERHFVIFFAFRLFCRKTMFRQKGLLSAERLSFGRNVRLNLDLIQKRSRILSWITECLAKHQAKLSTNEAKSEKYSCRRSLFLPKGGLLAETASFGYFCISTETNIFYLLSFGFWQKDKNSLLVDH